MDDLNLWITLWGAVIATILAAKELLQPALNQAKIKLTAEFLYLSVDQNLERDVQTIVTDEHGFERSVWIELTCVNSGSKAIQITSFYVEGKNNLIQIVPVNIPTVLEPKTQVQSKIQKEWFDIERVLDFGVMDALGQRHQINKKNFDHLIKRCKELPSSVKIFENKKTGEKVNSFKILDNSTTTHKTP